MAKSIRVEVVYFERVDADNIICNAHVIFCVDDEPERRIDNVRLVYLVEREPEIALPERIDDLDVEEEIEQSLMAKAFPGTASLPATRRETQRFWDTQFSELNQYVWRDEKWLAMMRERLSEKDDQIRQLREEIKQLRREKLALERWRSELLILNQGPEPLRRLIQNLADRYRAWRMCDPANPENDLYTAVLAGGLPRKVERHHIDRARHARDGSPEQEHHLQKLKNWRAKHGYLPEPCLACFWQTKTEQISG
ncbi:MAG TPA: hypothetical protein V6D22_25065 [Candidatus Obscuribacterales bacterium]